MLRIPFPRFRTCLASGKRGPEGFTLIEILVAVSVLAIALTVIMQLFSGGLRASRLSGEYTRGVFYAREKMAEFLVQERPEIGVFEGEFQDGYRWWAEVRPVEITAELRKSPPFEMRNIAVVVAWDVARGEDQFEITTLKMVPAEEADEGEPGR